MSRETWEMHDVRHGSGGTYYVISKRTNGVLDAGITVKATRHDTLACLTCHTTTCAHARFVKAYRTLHGDEIAA